MKNYQKEGFVIPLVLGIIALLVIGLGSYVYFNKHSKILLPNQTKNNIANQVINTKLSDDEIVSALGGCSDKSGNNTIKFTKNPKGDGYVCTNYFGDSFGVSMITHGDINNDGYEDAVVINISCGGSCGTSSSVVINQKDGTGKVVGYTGLNDALMGGGVNQTSIEKMSIDNGIISVTAQGFKDQTDWNTVVTKKFKLEGNNLVELTSTQNQALLNENTSGIIKSVYTKSGKNYIDIDYVEFVPGGPNGVGMENNNPKIRTLEISNNTKFLIKAFCTDKNNCTGNEKETITFDQFFNIFNKKDYYINNVTYLKDNPWDIVVKDNLITSITEHYIP